MKEKLFIHQVQMMELDLMKCFHQFCTEHGLVYYIIAGSMLGAVRHGGFIPWDDDIDVGMPRKDYERFCAVATEFSTKYEVTNYHTKKNCDYVLTRIYIPNTFIDNPILRRTSLDQRLYFDVFPLDNVPDEPEKREKQKAELQKYKRILSYVDCRNFVGDHVLKIFAKNVLSIMLKPWRNCMLARLDNIMRRYEAQNTQCICSMASQYSYEKQTMPREIYGTAVLYNFAGCEFLGVNQPQMYLTKIYGGDYMQLPPEEKRRKGHDIYRVEE